MTRTEENIDQYLSGEQLYGDDFTIEQIQQWYVDEKEGYADLGAKDKQTYAYKYHAMNREHGFRFLGNLRFQHALGLGSAYGDEFQPLCDRIERLTIVDPSDAFVSERVHGVPCRYVKPAVDGTLEFADETFDLETCFGVLHHIPNVSHVLCELYRCLARDGYALIREPIISMGDWRRPRGALTKHERGIPLKLFRQMIAATRFRIVSERLCGFRPVARVFRRSGGDVYCSVWGTRLDALLARAFAWNLRYHATGFFGKLRPTAVYYVLQKAK